MLAREADCERRQQTRSLLCASSLKVLVKSFGRPGHVSTAEAVKTTERKLQIAEQRVATLEASLTRQQEDAWRTTKSLGHSCRRAAANHSCKKVVMQCWWCQPRGNAEGAVFDCELPGAGICDSLCANSSSTARCGSCMHVVMHSRSDCQLDQLERLKGDQQRIVIEYQFSARLHEREFVFGQHACCGMRSWSGHVHYEEECVELGSARVLYFQVHSDFNELDKLRTRQCPPPSRRRCQAIWGVQRHPHRNNCLNVDLGKVWRMRGWRLSDSPKGTWHCERMK